MNNLTPLDKFSSLLQIIEDLWDEDYGILPFSISETDSRNIAMIRSDIKETDTEYILEAEIPGFTKDQINIKVENGYITIEAKGKEIKNEERKGFIRRERRYGNMKRTYKLQNIKEEEIKAKFENGILTIKCPKLKKRKSYKKIDIE